MSSPRSFKKKRTRRMDSELEVYQKIEITGPRGTREQAIVRGLFQNGKVMVEINGQIKVVDREDIET
jgi:hypothetical protein